MVDAKLEWRMREHRRRTLVHATALKLWMNAHVTFCKPTMIRPHTALVTLSGQLRFVTVTIPIAETDECR